MRKSKNSGLLASAEVAEADEASAPEADAMAVPAVVDGPEEGARTSVKMSDLCFIFGLRNEAEAVEEGEEMPPPESQAPLGG